MADSIEDSKRENPSNSTLGVSRRSNMPSICITSFAAVLVLSPSAEVDVPSIVSIIFYKFNRHVPVFIITVIVRD